MHRGVAGSASTPELNGRETHTVAQGDLVLTIQNSLSGLDDCEVKNRGGLEGPDPKVVTAVRKAADVATLVIARTVAKTQTDATR